jgi:hypothetical protein
VYRAVRTIVLASLASLFAVAGCKDKPKRQNPPANIASPSSGSGRRASPDLVLPHGDGTPPKHTTAPLTKADFEKLSKKEYPGFDLDVRQVGDKVVELRYKTKDHPRLWAVVTIQPCLDCIPMELEKWKAKTEELKVTLAGLKDSPDVTFEVGETKLSGQPIMYTYQVGTGTQKDVGGDAFGFTNNLNAYYNDGINQIKVVAAYKDDPATKDELIQKAPKDDLMNLAVSFLDAFTHQW